MADMVRHESKTRILLELIAAYKKPPEEVLMIEQAKERSVQQIEKRFKASKINHTYVFPRKLDLDDETKQRVLSTIKNFDSSIGYITQRVDSSRPLSNSKGNSVERLRNHSYMKNEQIIQQLKKAQDLLKKSSMSMKNKTPPSRLNNSANQNNQNVCKDLLKKIYESNHATKVSPTHNLRQGELYKNIEQMCKNSLNSNGSLLTAQIFKKQTSGLQEKLKLQNESIGTSPKIKTYQAPYTSRSINKLALSKTRIQTVNSCKSFESKMGKFTPSPQHAFNKSQLNDSNQSKHLSSLLKAITGAKQQQ